MRIAILNKFYAPDISPTARLAESLAHDRVRRGDSVTVVCSAGEYAQATEPQPRQIETHGLDVRRLWSPRLGKTTLWRRCLDYFAFYVQAFAAMLRLPRQDLVVVMTTPPFIAWAALLHTWLRGGDVVLWNMDCYPEVLENTGVIRKNGLLARGMRWLNRAMFRRVKHTVCLDAAMRELLVYQYSPPQAELAVTMIPNWEPVTLYADEVVVSNTATVGFDEPPQGDFLLLYAGNLGAGHTFDTILETADALLDMPVQFRFNGRGSRRQEIELAKEQRQLSNVVLHDYTPRANLLALLGAADCALITLRDDMLGVMSPSKLHANLAMGVPVLYIGPEGSNVDEAIRQFECGVSLRPGDAMGAVDFICNLMEDSGYHARLASRARRAFLTAYCDHQTLPQFDAVLQQAANQQREETVQRRAA